ncbi:MAG: transcriptional repressor LexA [Chthoniobacterales bacterium]
MNGDMTARQQEIFNYLRKQIANGITPTVREIGQAFGFSSPDTVRGHLDALERRGYIHREKGRSRNITLPGFTSSLTLRIPVFGNIPAGFAETSEQSCDEILELNEGTLGIRINEKPYALRVRGDSMTGAGILDGDTVILDQRPARHRDIVAALIDGETTLKRLIQGPKSTWLQAENPKYPDLHPEGELFIQGVFRALLRTHQP